LQLQCAFHNLSQAVINAANAQILKLKGYAWGFARQKMMHGGAESVEIRPGIGFPYVLLRWCITVGPDGRAGAGLQAPGYAEVDKEDSSIGAGRSHHVRRLQVAVQDRWSLSVQILQDVEHCACYVSDFLLGQTLAAPGHEVVLQVLAVDEVLNEAVTPILHEEVLNPWQPTVLQPRQQSRLLLETAPRLLAFTLGVGLTRHDLQSTMTFEGRIPHLVNGPHGARTELCLH